MRFFEAGSLPVITSAPSYPLPIEADTADASLPANASYSYVNESGLPEEAAQDAWLNGTTLDGRPIRDEIASAMSQWTAGLNSPSIAGGSLFFRNRYTMTVNPYDQMLQCTDAVEFDEILGGVCDATEGLAFQKTSLEMVDQDQEDVWNQIAKKIKLETILRQAWRELYKVSQVYIGVQWQQQIIKVRTPAVPLSSSEDDPPELMTSGAEDLHPSGVPRPGPRKRQRRKQFAIEAPINLTILDPTKVLPVGQLMFGQERFAYIATQPEDEAFRRVFEGRGSDPLVLKMFDGPYVPTPLELAVLSDSHKGPTNKAYLWLFKKDAIFRHTLSRAHYERFASIRLKSALPVLDMKSHLRASDRAALIGATNFIIVLKRGSDKFPARAGEVEQLREQSRVVARMPILVGDHRLSVEIVTPQTDFVLDEKRYNLLDARLIMRGLGSFRLTSPTARSSSEGAGSSGEEEISRGIESRRNDLARTFEEQLIESTVRRNPTVLTEDPQISFHPKRVVLNLDPNLMKLVLQLRDRGDISRETELEEFQLDQEIEYVRRKREKGIDDVFQSSVPFSSPVSNPFTTGNAGGRPPGGGGVAADSTPAAGLAAPKTPA